LADWRPIIPNLTLTLNAKAARGLVLTFVLSFVNLVGAFITLTAFGSLDEWTNPQFVGLFGTIEAGVGLAFLFAPNVWRLPVAEANTPRSDVRLAASTILIPHWLAAAKMLGGVLMMGYAGAVEGVGPATAGLVAEVALIGIGFLAFAVAAARLGVGRPDLDVVFVSLRRPGREPTELPGISLTGVGVQFVSNIGIFPAVELLSPEILYQPEFGPSADLLLWTTLIAGTSVAVALVAWHGRLAWHAPREQQREAEAELTASPG
jgi:hypothetical protein